MGLEGEQVGCDKILSIFLEIVTFYKKNYWVLHDSKNQSWGTYINRILVKRCQALSLLPQQLLLGVAWGTLCTPALWNDPLSYAQVHQSGSGWSPVVSATSFRFYLVSERNTFLRDVCLCVFKYVDDNLAVMSIGFLLSSPDDAVIWRGPKKNGAYWQICIWTVRAPNIPSDIAIL